MGMRNYLIEGVSGTGKTSVCKELQRRGYFASSSKHDQRIMEATTNWERHGTYSGGRG
jgi:predicted ATPase